MYRPPVVGEYIEDTEHENQEYSSPFGLESDSNHAAGTKTKDRNKETSNAPLSLEDETKEEEDEQDTAGKEEAEMVRCHEDVGDESNLLLLAVGFTDAGKSSKSLLLVHHRVGKDHEQAANNGKVAEEKVHVKDETVTKALNDDNGEQATNGKLGVTLEDDSTRAGKHGLTSLVWR